MPGITLEVAEAKVALYSEAVDKIILRQSFDMNGVKLTRANLAEVQEGLKYWQKWVQDLTPASSGGGMQMRTFIPG